MTNLLLKMFTGDCDPSSPVYRTRVGFLASITCIVCNIVLCSAKAAIGLISGSVSIVADAVNNLSDASSNIVSLIGFKLASKPADESHPYGHGRFEYLAGLAVAVIVSALGLDLVKESVGKIFSPEPSEFSAALVAILLGSMAVKFWMMLFNRSLGRRIDSETLIATAADSRNDVVTTGGVLACAAIGATTGVSLDGWAGVGVGAFITASGIGLIRDTVSPLLGQMPSSPRSRRRSSPTPACSEPTTSWSTTTAPAGSSRAPTSRWPARRTPSSRTTRSTTSSRTSSAAWA